MMVDVKVILDPSKVSQLRKIQEQALEMTAEAVLTDIKTRAVVPKETGELERSGHVDVSEIKRGVAYIVFDTPYARRLYFHPEYNFRTDKNPNARGKWMEDYHAGDRRQWVIETFGKFVKQLSGGLIQ